MKYTIKDCNYPFGSLEVFINGDVRPCCWSGDKVGNLNDSTMDEIWNGKLMMELRDYIMNDKVHPLCRNAACKYRQGYIK